MGILGFFRHLFLLRRHVFSSCTIQCLAIALQCVTSHVMMCHHAQIMCFQHTAILCNILGLTAVHSSTVSKLCVQTYLRTTLHPEMPLDFISYFSNTVTQWSLQHIAAHPNTLTHEHKTHLFLRHSNFPKAICTPTHPVLG